MYFPPHASISIDDNGLLIECDDNFLEDEVNIFYFSYPLNKFLGVVSSADIIVDEYFAAERLVLDTGGKINVNRAFVDNLFLRSKDDVDVRYSIISDRLHIDSYGSITLQRSDISKCTDISIDTHEMEQVFFKDVYLNPRRSIDGRVLSQEEIMRIPLGLSILNCGPQCTEVFNNRKLVINASHFSFEYSKEFGKNADEDLLELNALPEALREPFRRTLQGDIDENDYDREEALRAVKNDGLALRLLPDFKSDDEIVLEAVKQNGTAILFADNKYYSNTEIMLALARHKKCRYYFLRSIHDSLKKDIDFILAAYRIDPVLINVAESEEIMAQVRARDEFSTLKKVIGNYLQDSSDTSKEEFSTLKKVIGNYLQDSSDTSKEESLRK